MTITCAGCKTPVTDDVRFCRKCGMSLRPDDEAMSASNRDGRFDWNSTWLADILLSSEERARRRAALEATGRPEDLAVAELREADLLRKEIKNGIVTAFSGIGLTIFLLVFMGTIAALQTDPRVAAMFNSLWVVGIIPFLVGVGILVNAFFVSGRFSRHRQRVLESVLASERPGARESVRTSSEFLSLEAPPSVVPSVVEHTTHRLADADPRSREASSA